MQIRAAGDHRPQQRRQTLELSAARPAREPRAQDAELPYQHITDDIVDQTALVVFDVDKDAGFRLRGLIDQLPLYVASLETFNADQAPCGAVRRSVLMNDPDLGGYVYAVSTAGITASPLVDELPVVKSVPFEWASGEWTTLRLQVRKAGAGWVVEGKAWPATGAEPTGWQISIELKEAPSAGRAGLWGSPYSGTPIRFDDLVIAPAS